MSNKLVNLYVKCHNDTNLQYFGKTTKDDVNSYMGSGLYWSNHIKKHSYNVKTMIVGRFQEDDPSLVEFSLGFSAANGIVKSSDWANLVNETGLGGGWEHINSQRGPGEKYNFTGEKNGMYNNHHTQETKDVMSLAHSGEKHHYYGLHRSEKDCLAISAGVKIAMDNFSSEKKKMINDNRNRIWYKKSEDEKGRINNLRSETLLKNISTKSNVNWIEIYDGDDILKFSCKGNFGRVCQENNLPQRVLKISYQKNGKKLYENKIAKNKDWQKYKNWYAIKIEKDI